MKKIRRIILPFIFSLLIMFLFSFAGAADEEDTSSDTFLSGTEISFDDGVIYEDVYVCDCCHSHSHSDSIMGRLSCFLCKISMYFRNLFSKGETDVVHKYVFTAYVPSSCAYAGKIVYSCVVCGFETNIRVPEEEHEVYSVEGVAPTCEEPGYNSYVKCYNCDYSTYAEIPPTGHTAVTDKGYAPTCTAKGLTDGSHCEVCEKVIVSQKTIEPTGHSFNDGDTVSGLTVYITGTDKVIADFTCRKCSAAVSDCEINAVASVGGYSKVYHTLEAAMKSAGGKTVYLLKDYTLKESITVSKGVTLVIPCTNGDVGYYTRSDDVYNKFCPDNASGSANVKKFRTFNVPEGKTITVASGGTLLINAVTGLAAGGNPHSYGITGNYAEISLSGNINVKNGGIFDCSGFVRDGGGTVKLEKGAAMYETYGILHWRGGSYGFAARAKKIFPIDGYEMNYMKAKLIVEAGSIVEGSCKMYAGDSYHYCHIKILGNKDGYLYKTSDSTRVERTVEKDTEKTVIKVYGDVEIGVTSISAGGVTMKTSSFQSYKVDGNCRMEVYDGTLSSNQKVQYMPGFTMVIGKGATLEIEGSLLTKGSMVFCTADDVTCNGTLYKGYCTLDSGYVGAAGAYCPSDRGDAALYVVDGGKVNVAGNSAALAGKVYVDSESSVSFNSDSKKEVTVKLATGKVNGSSFLARVDTVNYTIPFMQYELP